MKLTITSVGVLALLLTVILAPAVRGVEASGGQVTNDIGGYRIHVFTDVGEHTFSVSEGGTVDVLVVGGGGGGGVTMGGGGGGGGVLFENSHVLTAGVYKVTVGAGGLGGYGYNNTTLPLQAGVKGDDSAFGEAFVAIGGGGGAGWSGHPPTSGGSGGGGNTSTTGSPPGTGTDGQGYGGGVGNNTGGQRSGGGGGGASEVGINGVANAGGKGGDGREVFGTYYGGGGGGGVEGSALNSSGGGAGGLGGGGAGSRGTTNAIAGMANTGGGGGGSGYDAPRFSTIRIGGNGGSGIVIVRYSRGPAAPLDVSVAEPDPIGATNATLRGQLTGGYGDAEPPSVYFCLGSEDGGTASTGDWERVTFVGDDVNPGDLFVAVISGLKSGSNYTYRAYVTNTTGEAWSSTAQAFQTAYLPAVTNLGSVDGRVHTWLRGEVTDTGAQTPQTWFEWWVNGSAETNRIDMDVQDGVFSNSLTRLEPNVSYYYRVVASNAAGLTASQVEPFATLADGWYVTTDGSDSAAGTSWTEAFASVSNALAHAADWDVILVSNGVYELTAALTINSGVTLRGVDGAASTTLRRDGSATHRIITMTHADAMVEGFTIADGRAGGNPEVGSGIHMTGGTVRSCIITNNIAHNRQARGGGVYMNGGVLEDCVIVDNRANGSDGSGLGSGILATGGALIQRCRIYGNQVNGSYTPALGAVYLDAGANILRNSLIYGNEAGGSVRPTPTTLKVAGVYSAGTANRVEYSTIVGNVSQYGIGVGLYMFRGHAVNNIVYFNHTEFGGDYRTLHQNAYATPDRADTSISHTCAYPLVDGAGNITADPLFADWQNGDFSLLPGSPALDTADSISGMTTDFYGVERDRDGNGNGTGAPDMGAIEAEAADAGPLRCGLVAAVNESVGSTEFTYTAHVAGSNTTGLTYAWDFENDDVVNASSATAAYTFGVGWHDVKLTVSNAANDSVTLVREDDARVAPAVIYVAEGADHIFPFASLADAATNVQSAVNAALATETAVSEVLVNDGHYLLGRQVIVDRGIVLRSENGAESTILDAQEGSPRRVMELYQGAAEAVVAGFTLTGGRVSSLYYGAGINMFAGTVQHCVITNNIASGRNASQGGGVRMFGGVLRRCTIIDNRSAASDGGGAGGGVWASGGNALIDRCRIVGNRATASTSWAYGGGVYLTGNATLRNSIVAGNYANNNPSTHRGSGVYVNHADSRVENCTIVDNYIDAGDSAGLYQNNGTVVNTILWRNYLVGLEGSLPDHKNYVYVAGSIDYCNTYPEPSGEEHITSDPMFIDRAAGDYRLSIGSPAIDAGTPVAAVTNDFAGASRPLDGNDDGTPMHDIGAYEFDPAQIDTLICSFSADPAQGVDSLEAVFSAFVAGPGSDNVVYYWDFNNDGFFETEGIDKSVVTNTYGIGIYSVTLVVSNLVEQTGATHIETDYIMVIPSTVYVATNGLHISPFHTLQNAATNIHDAVTAVASGGEVLVHDGVYSITEQIAITRPLTVRGVNGALTTIIERDAGAGNTRIVHMSDTNALLEGFTVRGGFVGSMEWGGGIYLDGGTVRACVVVSNRTSSRYGEGAGIYLTAGGLVENSLIVGNRNASSEPTYGRAEGGGIRMTGGIVRNCTIVGNSAATGGGIQRSGGNVVNTIIVGNQASYDGTHNISGATTAFTFSCSPDLNDGVDDNITADPQFVDPGEGYGLTHVVGDYRLDYAISPAMDTGINQPWMLDAVDLDGLPRILMGTVDMGCYETPPPRGSLFLFR